jgi:lipopolysaccharide export system permease protein
VKPTLYKYITNEIWPTFLVSLFVSVFIILATKMLSIMELIITRGAPLSYVIGMIGFMLPDVIAFALPAASLIAVVVAFLRLSADNEIIALKSSGISLYGMLPPVITLSLLGFFIAILISIIAVPWGNRSFKDLVFKIVESKADLGIKPNIFCEPFDKIIFYVNGFSNRDKTMQDVFVVDMRDKDITNTIIAEQGKILLHPEKKIISLHFRTGTIFITDKALLQSARTIEFKTYELNIDLQDIMASLASRQKKPKEMSIAELRAQSNSLPPGSVKHNESQIELFERFSIPLAVFLMGIIGVPLGAQIRSKGRTTGISVSLIIFFIYYMCLAGVRGICETGAFSPVIGVWIPDVFLLLCGIYLLWLSSKEQPISLPWGAVKKIIKSTAGSHSKTS